MTMRDPTCRGDVGSCLGLAGCFLTRRILDAARGSSCRGVVGGLNPARDPVVCELSDASWVLSRGREGLSAARDPRCGEGPVGQWILSVILETARGTKLEVAPLSGAERALTIDLCSGLTLADAP